MWRTAAVLLAALAVQAQEPAPAPGYRFTMSYDRPGLTVPHWMITVPVRGMATYVGRPEKGVDPGEVLFRVSDSGRRRISAWMERSHNMRPCETRTKGIANMGMKDVTYAPADAPEVRCAFNYTDNKALNETAEYLLGIAGTLQAGLELDRLHRYDRLGLDPVISRLAEEAKEGHAVELGAIRPTLESLVTDTAVLERVRLRAQQLLELAKMQERQGS